MFRVGNKRRTLFSSFPLPESIKRGEKNTEHRTATIILQVLLNLNPGIQKRNEEIKWTHAFAHVTNTDAVENLTNRDTAISACTHAWVLIKRKSLTKPTPRSRPWGAALNVAHMTTREKTARERIDRLSLRPDAVRLPRRVASGPSLWDLSIQILETSRNILSIIPKQSNTSPACFSQRLNR